MAMMRGFEIACAAWQQMEGACFDRAANRLACLLANRSIDRINRLINGINRFINALIGYWMAGVAVPGPPGGGHGRMVGSGGLGARPAPQPLIKRLMALIN